MHSFKLKQVISAFVLVSIFLTLMFLVNTAQATELVPGAPGEALEEPADGADDGGDDQFPQEERDILTEYEDQLTEEQLAALEAAFSQMKDSIMTAEKEYQDAVKSLKDDYRDAIQSATKSIEDDKELAAVIDRAKTDILSDNAKIQDTLDSAVFAARLIFTSAAETALVPAEIVHLLASWHENKEINAADQLIHFVESFKNQGGKSDEEHGQGNNEAKGNSDANENNGQQSMQKDGQQYTEMNQYQEKEQDENQEQEKNQTQENDKKQTGKTDKGNGGNASDQKSTSSQKNSAGKGKGGK